MVNSKMGKKTTRSKSKAKFSFGRLIASFLVCFIIVAVPVFSIMGLGNSIRSSKSEDNRITTVLPAIQQRPVDSTTLPPQLFNEPLISVTFDDGYESVYKSAVPLLQKYGIRTTQYVLSGTFNDKQYVSWEQIGQMQKAGHEIACHTYSHADLVQLDDTNLEIEIGGCKTELTKRFGTVDNFAAPYGSTNGRSMVVIKKYFTSARNTDGDPTNGVTDDDVNVRANFDRYDIMGVTVRHNTTVDELKTLVDYAKAHNAWVVLTYHQADDGPSQWGLDPAKLETQLKYLSETNVRIVTMKDALQTTILQKVEY